MSNLQTGLLILHTLIALAIIGLVLLQRGKGAEAGAAFGSGASGTVFGARGSTNFFSRTTAVLATLFFLSSLALAFMSSQHATQAPKSLIETAAPIEPEQPAAEGTTEQLPELPALEESEGTSDADMLPALPEDESNGQPKEPDQ